MLATLNTNEHSRSELPATVAFSSDDENGANKKRRASPRECVERWTSSEDGSSAAGADYIDYMHPVRQTKLTAT